MRALPLLALCQTLLVSTCLQLAGQDAPPRPNVLFLICDDLNCDLGSYGHPQVRSPNIDRLASRGVRFQNAHCQFPLCGPSRASFMTGLYPDQTLVYRNQIYIREHLPDVLTIPQMFRDKGYSATRIGKIFHYNVPNHIGTGGHDDPFSWDHTINPRGRDKDEEDLIFSLTPGSFGGTLSWLAAEGTDAEQTDGIIADEAVRLLEQHARTGRPFYLAVGFFRPHTPYVAPKKYFDLYPLEGIEVPRVPDRYLESIPAPARRTLTRKRDQLNLEEGLAKRAIQAYHASITFVDAQVGRVLDALERTGLADNTVVLFTSDHSYHMGEHGYWQKTTLFENATHVPLILAGPGIDREGAVTEAPVEMTDFYPTLAELCGLTPPKHVAGVSLVPALRDPAARPRSSAFTQYASGYSLRTERYRYTEWGEDAEAGVELYDHTTDPAEMKNLAGSVGVEAITEELSAELRRRIAAARKAPAGLKQIE